MNDVYHPNFPNVELRSHLEYLEKQVPKIIHELNRQKLDIEFKIQSYQSQLEMVRRIVSESK